MKAILSSQKNRITYQTLVDTDATDYFFIDEIKAQIVCQILDIEFIPLSKSRPLKGFDEVLVKKFITHMINPIFTVQNHTESLCPMLITRLSNHLIIIDKP